MNRTLGYGAGMYTHQIPQRMLIHLDSRTVAMEVGIC